MSFLTVSYNPEWHNRLLSFMQGIYPHRDVRYLDWWLSNIDCYRKCWDKCAIVLDNDKIIGCTTVNVLDVNDSNGRKRFFAQANTILLPDYRGKGLSRRIYERYNYPDWITFGFTDIAWNIQRKYVKDFTPINPVNVYVSLSLRGFISSHVWRLMKRRTLKDCKFPKHVGLGRKEELVLIKGIDDVHFPNAGKWNGDDIEIVRNREYFQKRFFNIFNSDKYYIYNCFSHGVPIGYVVFRGTVYKGIDMVSLVDFRFKKRKDEMKALNAAVAVAGHCGIGFVITLTSRNWGHRLSPLTVLMKKKLHSAVGTKEKTDKLNEMLVTSADSDLDFVYYK